MPFTRWKVAIGFASALTLIAAQPCFADSQFAIELYKQLRQDHVGKNLLLSPLSLSMALTMVAGGARGETLTQLQHVLHIDGDLAARHAAYHALLKTWGGGEKKPYQLRIANRLWGQKGFTIEQPFLTLTRDQYDAPMTTLDFANSEASRAQINQWVETQTEHRIKNLIPAGAVGATTRLVLTNAVYFKGNWVAPFSPKLTADGEFAISSAQNVSVPFMHRRGEYGYYQDDKLQALELNYAGGELSLVILLPRAPQGLAPIEEGLNTTGLNAILAKIAQREVIVSLPRFKMATEFDAKSALAALGANLAFEGAADFSGITNRHGLYLSAVLHKAFIDVNETGTEAAAATGIVMRLNAIRIERDTPEFKANHPFVMILRDQKSGEILFMGRLIDPTVHPE